MNKMELSRDRRHEKRPRNNSGAKKSSDRNGKFTTGFQRQT